MMSRQFLSAPCPEAEDTYHVFSLRYAHAPGRRVGDNFCRRMPTDGPMQLDYLMFVLHNAHHTILVDTGMSPQTAERLSRPLDFDPIRALAAMGLSADTVDRIILTHMHFDHSGNIDRLPTVPIHIQGEELRFVTGRAMTESAIRWAFDVDEVSDLTRRLHTGTVHVHEGDAGILPGISVHLLPGHSMGMQAVRVKTPRGPVVLAGDVCHYYANFLRREPFSLTLDMLATLRSYDRLWQLAGNDLARIIPGHDPKLRVLYPQEMFDGVQLTALHKPPTQFTAQFLAELG